MRKRGNIRRFLIMIHCKQGQRSGKIHMIFQGQLRERSPLYYHRSQQTAPLCHDRRSTLWLFPSLHLAFPYSLPYWPPGIRQHSPVPSACILKLRDHWRTDGWMKGLEKKGEGKVNSQVSNECCWVSFISFRLRASLTTTRQHTW